MDDVWMQALRREPSAEFKEQLRRRLRDEDAAAPAPASSSHRVALAAAAVVVLSALLAVPAVRASVSQFLSLFRVVNFVAVQVQPSRLDQLKAQDLEIGKLIGEHAEMLADPGPPVAVASLDEAASLAGMSIAVPQWLPADSRIIETAVMGERVVRITASATRLQQVMDALGITDLSAPAALEGQVVNLRVPPVVMVRYEHGTNRRSRLFQAQAPHVTLPTSVDLATLGEIGLRILGLSAGDAKQFAQAIDWHTTLLVPVPPNVSSFKQVTIGGRPGILLEHQPPNQSPTTAVMWSTTERVFALVSIHGLDQVLTMADSVR
ncbi:MAG: hypothetical protein ACRD2N_18685 [Vicinamibacterales bacterium]